ncbi:MAG TPA: MarR family transcriptional regulator [Steroidobacteraceae bacterium]
MTPKRSAVQRDDADSRPQLERLALFASRTLVDRMRTLYRELERQTDAPITMHRALACIGNEPGISASRLADALGMQRPAVSHVLKGLAERRWIERKRQHDDQRSVRLYVTAAGKAILGATAGRASGTLQRSVRRLSDEALAGLALGLQALLEHLPDTALSRAMPQRRNTGRR